MTDVPRAVLSEHLQQRMAGRRLRSAVFFTYKLDPGFFEQEVLPVFLDVPLSHAAAIRLVQLEYGLWAWPGEVAVYYDARGLETFTGSAKLDIRRIPVRHRTGYFHPKNVLLLVEDPKPNDEGDRGESLLVASLSANLTRAGWWENVEACHVEEIAKGARTRLREGLLAFLRLVRGKAPSVEHHALDEILAFLKSTGSVAKRSHGGRIHTHFYDGKRSLPDFLDDIAGARIRGAYLEVISPYFDDAVSSEPLAELVRRFQPKELRVLLPRGPGGEALCRAELYEAVRAMPGVAWGRLPKEILRRGRKENVAERFVHAKVYRFFTQSPKSEVWFVGSANLTRAAHSKTGNVESGFLVHVIPPRRPDFWLTVDAVAPKAFDVRTEGEGVDETSGTPLSLRYRWDEARAAAFWDASRPSPTLRLEANGVDVAALESVASRVWVNLDTATSARVAEALRETSLFRVLGDREGPAYLLVQEEGMSHKPSLLFQLSVADILHYWSLLTQEQRAAFLESRASADAFAGDGAELIARVRPESRDDGIFERFAGVFHAFATLERSVRGALVAGDARTKEATYRLFGKKYDSLSSLLDRVEADRTALDDVDRYVLVLCAMQLCDAVERDFPTYWSAHLSEAGELRERLGELREHCRTTLIADRSPDMSRFLEWLEPLFLRRAQSPTLEIVA